MINLWSHHQWKLRLGQQLFPPHQQVPKRAISRFEEAKSPRWQAEDPIAPGLPNWDEVDLISPSPPEISTSERSASECDTHSMIESGHETTSYWEGSIPALRDPSFSHNVGPQGNNTTITESSSLDIQQWLDDVVDGLVSCTMGDDRDETPQEVRPEETQHAPGQSVPPSAGPKRMRGEINRPGNDGDETDSSQDIQRPKRQRAVDEPSSRFACHFFKRNPHRYMGNRTCTGPGWTTTHRVKEHLYRRHMLPRFSCPQCQTALATNQLLTVHLKMATPCSVHDGEPLEGVSPDVERELRKRNRSATEEKKWLDMYQLLFPDDEAATYPTPYYEYADERITRDVGVDMGLHDNQRDLILEYEDFLCDDLPQQIQDELQKEVDERFGVYNTINARVVDLARNFQLRLLHFFLDQRSHREKNADAKATQSLPSTPSAALDDMEGEMPSAFADNSFPNTTLDRGSDDFEFADSFDFTKFLANSSDEHAQNNGAGSSVYGMEYLPLNFYDSFTPSLFDTTQQGWLNPPGASPLESLEAAAGSISRQNGVDQTKLGIQNDEASARSRQYKRQRQAGYEKRLKELEQRLIEITGGDDVGSTSPTKASGNTRHRDGYESAGYASSRASSTGSISSAFPGGKGGWTKPFACPAPGCTYGPFSTQSLLDSHKMVHSNERQYHCSVNDCSRGKEGVGFKRLNELNRHQLVHTTHLVYTCSFCPNKTVKFKRSDGFLRHLKIYHPEKTGGNDYLGYFLSSAQEKRATTEWALNIKK